MELHYPHIISQVLETPWAIQETKLHAIAELIALRASGGRFTPEEIRARIADPAAAMRPPMPAPMPAGGMAVAVLPIVGTITQRADMLTEISGGATTERIAAQFREFIADPSVRAIILDIHSPGGAVYGMDELAALIYNARGPKPIVAVANSLAASGAYWIGASAGEFVVTPSGEVGSIGVFSMHEDLSKMLDALGVNVTLISAGKYKVEGNPFEPLSDEARAAIQARIDSYYQAFVARVARGRGVSAAAVRGGFGQGRMVRAEDAVRLGMADRVATLEETIQRFLPRSSRAGDGSASRAEAPEERAGEPLEGAQARPTRSPAIDTDRLATTLAGRLKEGIGNG